MTITEAPEAPATPAPPARGSQIVAAFIRAQKAFTTAAKDTNNPFYNRKYADLASVWAAVREPLAENDLSITQEAGMQGELLVVTTTLLHVSGESMAGTWGAKPAKMDPQGIGAATTYARRMGLCCLLGVVADDDDDGNAASGKTDNRATVAAGSAASPPSAPAAAAGPSEAQAAVDRMWKEGQPAPGQAPAGQAAAAAAPRRASVKSASTSAAPPAPATSAPGAPVMTGTYPYTRDGRDSGPRLTPYEAGAWPEMAEVNDVAQFAKAMGLHVAVAYGADKVSAVKIPFDVAMDLKVSDAEPVVLRRCSKRQISELLTWLKEAHKTATTANTEAK